MGGRSEGKRFLVRAERGESGSAAAAGRSCLSSAPSSRPASPSSSRPPCQAGRCRQPEQRRWAEQRGVGSGGRRASVLSSIPPGPLLPLSRVAPPGESRTGQQTAGRSSGQAEGSRGAMSHQGKKSIPHITVSAPTLPWCFVAWGWSPSRSRALGGGQQGRPRRLPASPRVGRGPFRRGRPLPLWGQ